MANETLEEITEEDFRAGVGERLRAAILKKYGYRAESLFAESIGVSQATISDICRGNTAPSAFTLFKIDQFSSIDIKKLLRG